MPPTVASSSGWISRDRWIVIPGLGLHPRLAVTSIRTLLEGKSRQEWGGGAMSE